MTDTSSGNSYYYVHDHLYSPAVLVDYDGTVLERYEYDAYGNARVLDADFTADADGLSDYGNPYLFTGRRMDILDSKALVVQYNRNRYYDWHTGRWLTHDPLGISNGSGKGCQCKCANCSHIESCLAEVKRRTPYKGNYWSNCQVRVKRQISECCLTSNWTPPWYAMGR